MQTRFYDSAEPGPPHGWLDENHGVPSKEQPVWENLVSIIQQAARRLADALRTDVSLQMWGSLRMGGSWWIYHVIPAGEDRFGRPGRTLTVLFCSGSKASFDWSAICAVAPEMETLAKNRNHWHELLRSLDRFSSSASLTDDLLKLSPTSLLDTLKSEMACLLDGLGEGSHEYFTISENGTVSNRGREDTRPKPPPPPPPPTPKPTAKTVPHSAPVKNPQPHKPPHMKNFSWYVFVIGLLLGFGLRWVTSPQPAAEKPPKNPPVLRSDEDAITQLNKVIEYLEQRPGRGREPFPPREPQTQPQNQTN